MAFSKKEFTFVDEKTTKQNYEKNIYSFFLSPSLVRRMQI
jgi:hypothetical protein